MTSNTFEIASTPSTGPPADVRYILYLIWSQKGKMVLSPEYAEIIAATPHIKYKTSPLVWIVLALLIIGLVAAVFWAAASGMR